MPVTGGCAIQLLLGVARREKGFLACDLITEFRRPIRSRLFRRHLTEEQIAEWKRICEIVERERLLARLRLYQLSGLPIRRQATSGNGKRKASFKQRRR